MTSTYFFILFVTSECLYSYYTYVCISRRWLIITVQSGVID